MTKNTRVRIIKRVQRSDADTVEQKHESKEKTPQELAREMTATVAGWITEHQLKRERETNRGFPQLFDEAA